MNKPFNNELRGVLFHNAKGNNPNRPDYKGKCQVDGVTYVISGWKREARESKEVFLSLQFERQAPAPLTKPATDAAPFNDEIPF
jgi:hypothetical protein